VNVEFGPAALIPDAELKEHAGARHGITDTHLEQLNGAPRAAYEAAAKSVTG
jgi:hypothetical protein